MEKKLRELDRQLDSIGIDIDEGRYDDSRADSLIFMLAGIKSLAESSIEELKRRHWEVVV